MRKFFVALLAIVATAKIFPQAIDLSFHVPSVNGKRSTFIEDLNFAPYWLDAPSTMEFKQNVAGANLPLINFCLDPNGDDVAITVSAGTLPAGLTLTSGTVSGTPTTLNSSVIVKFKCQEATGDFFAEHQVTFSIVATGTDTIPFRFTFKSVSNASQLTVSACNAATILGIDSPATITVTGSAGTPQYQINGGTWTNVSGTVNNGDTVAARGTTASVANTTTHVTVTIGGITGTCAVTTATTVPRVGIIGRNDFDSFIAPIVNPEGADEATSEWPVGLSDPRDGVAIKHPGESRWNYGTIGDLRDHFVIRNAATARAGSGCEAPVNGLFFATLHIWNDMSYATGGYQTRDRPRVDMNRVESSKALVPLGMEYRTSWWTGFALCLPADYVEENQGAQEEYLFKLPNRPDLGESVSMFIVGSIGQGASWRFQLNRAAPGSTSIVDDVKHWDSPITAANIGQWTYFVWHFDIDNCPLVDVGGDNCASAGTPITQWWVGTEATGMQIIANDTVTPYGFDASAGEINLFTGLSKPNYRGAVSGSYTGNKTGEVWIAFDALRVGGDTSSFADVHPTQMQQP